MDPAPAGLQPRPRRSSTPRRCPAAPDGRLRSADGTGPRPARGLDAVGATTASRLTTATRDHRDEWNILTSIEPAMSGTAPATLNTCGVASAGRPIPCCSLDITD